MQGTEYLQSFILQNPKDWKEKLESAPYNLKISEDGDFVLFKYNQLSSDFSLPEVQEARGTILHKGDWEYVCRAFDKFGNYGESYVEPLDWEHGVSVQEKIDGSLCKIWCYAGIWHLSTNGTIDAFKAETGDLRFKTFGDLFLAALKRYGFSSVQELGDMLLQRHCTFMFELVSPVNRVVVPYEEFRLYFLGCRSLMTLNELNVRHILCEVFDVPKIFPISSLSDVINAANTLPWDEEGYVCVDQNFKRCKIKSPQYVKAHYVRSNGCINERHLLEVILSGEEEEFLIYAPDYSDRLNEIKALMNDASKEAETIFSTIPNDLPKKEFAQYVLTHFGGENYTPYLFKKYNNPNLTFELWVKDWNANKWLKYLGLKEKNEENI